MITLQVADLIVIAARVLDQDTDTVLQLLDLQAAQDTLAELAPLAADQQDPAQPAATLLSALLRRPPLPTGGEQLALMATAQFLALNGYELDLEPPEATTQIIADTAAGRLDNTHLAGWLVPRLTPLTQPTAHSEDPCTRRPGLSRWLPSLPTRRRGIKPKDPFHRYTDRARTVLVLAQDQARLLRHNYLGTEHLLLGLTDQTDGIAASVFAALGITGQTVRHHVEDVIGRGAHTPTGHIPFTPRAKKVLTVCALREAMQLGHNYIGTEHLLLGLLNEGDGVAAQVLIALGADHASVHEQVIQLLPHHQDHEPPAAQRQLLNKIREAKEAAIDQASYDIASALRDIEKKLLTRHPARDRTESPNTEILAAAAEETQRLLAETERLRSLLRQHGIDPDEGPSQAAHA